MGMKLAEKESLLVALSANMSVSMSKGLLLKAWVRKLAIA